MDPSKDSKDLANRVKDCMGPADQSIECSGAEASFHTAIHVSCCKWNIIKWVNVEINIQGVPNLAILVHRQAGN